MKVCLFVASVFFATCASAQTIQVTSELSMSGKIVEAFHGSKPNGETQTYSDIKNVPYRKAVRQIGGEAKVEPGLYETGFKMQITPVIASEGMVRYRLSVSQRTLTKLEPKKVGNLVIDLPASTDDSFTQSMIAKSGEPHEFRFGFDQATGTNKYTLKVTATPLQD